MYEHRTVEAAKVLPTMKPQSHRHASPQTSKGSAVQNQQPVCFYGIVQVEDEAAVP